MKRDDFHRCRLCKKIFADAECLRDPDTGVLLCPDGCRASFEQPPYEPPNNL